MLIASINTKAARTLIAVRWIGEGARPSFNEHAEAVAAIAGSLVSGGVKNPKRESTSVNVVYGAFPQAESATGDAIPRAAPKPTPQRIKEAVRLLTRAAGTSDVAEQYMLVSTAMLVLNSFDLGHVPA